MLIKNRKKGFTLVELIVVMSIIAILATVSIVGYNYAQIKSRDNKRKSDLQAIATAYLMHYQDTKSWSFSNAELLKIDATTTATGEGSGTGNGYFNYPYTSSGFQIVRALTGSNYLASSLRDPMIANDTTQTTSTSAQYFKAVCKDSSGKAIGVIVAARLESLNDSNAFSIDPVSDLTGGVCTYTGSYATLKDRLIADHYNYAVEAK